MLGCKVLSSWESLLGVPAVRQCCLVSATSSPCQSHGVCVRWRERQLSTWQGQIINSSTVTLGSFPKPAYLVKINQERERQWSCSGGGKNAKSLNPCWSDPVVFVERTKVTGVKCRVNVTWNTLSIAAMNLWHTTGNRGFDTCLIHSYFSFPTSALAREKEEY